MIQNRNGPNAPLFQKLSRHAPTLFLFGFPPLLLIVVAHVLFSAGSVPIWDAEQASAPYYSLLADSVRSFQPIFWNPLNSGGSPDYAVPDFALLSPVTAAMAFVFGGSLTSFRFYWFLVWVFGAWGLGVLGRYLKAPVWGICVVCAGVLFSGVHCGQAQHITFVLGLSIIPWIIWRLEVAVATRRLQPALEAGVLWGLSALCTYIALTALTGCYVGLWLLGRLLFNDSETPMPPVDKSDRGLQRGIFGIIAIGLFGIVGLCIMSPIVTGLAIETAGYSSRSGVLPRSIAITENALDPVSLFSFASPYVSMLQFLSGGTIWANANSCMCSVYTGVLTTVFGIAALFLKGRSRWRTYLFSIGFLFLLAALGYHTPLRGWLYDYFLPTRFFRHPSIFRLYWIITIAMLSLYGARDIEEILVARDRRESARLFAVASILAIAGIFWTTTFSIMTHIQLSGLANIHLFGIWIATVVMCGTTLIPSLKPVLFRRFFSVALLAIASLDALISFELNRPMMCMESPGIIQFWNTVEASHLSSLDLRKDGFERTHTAFAFEPHPDKGVLHNFQLIWKMNVLRNYSPLSNVFYNDIWRSPELARGAIGANRTWFAATVPEVPATDANFAAFRDRAKILGTAPLVRHTRESVLALSSAGDQSVSAEIAGLAAPENVPIQLQTFAPNGISFETIAPKDGWLLVTERWANGWRAKVNGMETPVMPGNFIFRCVKVPAGRILVEFSYHPFGLPALLYLSAGVMVLIGALSLVQYVRHSRERIPLLEEPGLAGPSAHSTSPLIEPRV